LGQLWSNLLDVDKDLTSSLGIVDKLSPDMKNSNAHTVALKAKIDTLINGIPGKPETRSNSVYQQIVTHLTILSAEAQAELLGKLNRDIASYQKVIQELQTNLGSVSDIIVLCRNANNAAQAVSNKILDLIANDSRVGPLGDVLTSLLLEVNDYAGSVVVQQIRAEEIELNIKQRISDWNSDLQGLLDMRQRVATLLEKYAKDPSILSDIRVQIQKGSNQPPPKLIRIAPSPLPISPPVEFHLVPLPPAAANNPFASGPQSPSTHPIPSNIPYNYSRSGGGATTSEEASPPAGPEEETPTPVAPPN
jgi:hypothetical protein